MPQSSPGLRQQVQSQGKLPSCPRQQRQQKAEPGLSGPVWGHQKQTRSCPAHPGSGEKHNAPAMANCEPGHPSPEGLVAPTWNTTEGSAHCPGRQTGPRALSRTCPTGAAPPGDVGSSPKVAGPPSRAYPLPHSGCQVRVLCVETLDHICQSQGPRATSGPQEGFLRPLG